MHFKKRLVWARYLDLKSRLAGKRQAFPLMILSIFLSGCEIGGQIESIGSSIGDMFSGLLK